MTFVSIMVVAWGLISVSFLLALFLENKKIEHVSMAISVLLIIILLTAIVGKVIGEKQGKYFDIKTEQIIAIQDGFGTSGRGGRSYFKINSDQYVVLAIGTKNHYEIKTIPASDCKFYSCKNDEEPHLVTRQFFIYHDTFFEEEYNYYKYHVYVPQECLQSGFTIDLE